MDFSFCLVLAFKLFARDKELRLKGFRNDFRRVVIQCGRLFKTMQRRPSVNLNVCLVLFVVQYGDIA